MKVNFNILFKRGCAYLIDTFIVFLLSLVISLIPFFNIYGDKYERIYSDFSIVLDEYLEVKNVFKEYYDDKTINQDEYGKLLLFENYKEYFIEEYEDEVIDQDEYDDILEDIEEKYLEMSVDFEYERSRVSIVGSIITLACLLGYFGIGQYLLKGQTIGKKLFKLKVVTVDDKRVSLINFIVRSLIVNNVFINSLNVLALYFLNKDNYFDVAEFLNFITNAVEAVIIFLILIRVDSRGLHDLVAKTKVVVSEEKILKDKYKKKIIEGDFTEK